MQNERLVVPKIIRHGTTEKMVCAGLGSDVDLAAVEIQSVGLKKTCHCDVVLRSADGVNAPEKNTLAIHPADKKMLGFRISEEETGCEQAVAPTLWLVAETRSFRGSAAS